MRPVGAIQQTVQRELRSANSDPDGGAEVIALLVDDSALNQLGSFIVAQRSCEFLQRWMAALFAQVGDVVAPERELALPRDERVEYLGRGGTEIDGRSER